MMGLLASTRRMVEGYFTEQRTSTETELDGRSLRDEDASRELSKDQMFDILRNSRRRAVLTCLRTHGPELSVKELSTYVAAEEYGIPAEELSSEQYKRVYTGLYQCHLGRMAELGVLDFDSEQNTVQLHGVASQLDPYLPHERSLKAVRFEFGIAILVASVVALGTTEISPIGTLSPILLASVTVAALFGLALFQLFDPNERSR